jgi:hypothetical protein
MPAGHLTPHSSASGYKADFARQQTVTFVHKQPVHHPSLSSARRNGADMTSTSVLWDVPSIGPGAYTQWDLLYLLNVLLAVILGFSARTVYLKLYPESEMEVPMLAGLFVDALTVLVMLFAFSVGLGAILQSRTMLGITFLCGIGVSYGLCQIHFCHMGS